MGCARANADDRRDDGQRDAFLLASLRMIERSDIMHALLVDGMARDRRRW
jgi:hypothetical protein